MNKKVKSTLLFFLIPSLIAGNLFFPFLRDEVSASPDPEVNFSDVQSTDNEQIQVVDGNLLQNRELLNELPMWEYMCSESGEYVDQDAECGVNEDQKPERVPPRFLKSEEALRDYLQNSSQGQAAWESYQKKFLKTNLSLTLTEESDSHHSPVFSDGFELGNFSLWTGTNATPTVGTTTSHHGTYSAGFATSGELSYKEFATSTTLYTRIYTRFNTVPSNGENFMVLRIREGSNNVAYLQISKSAGGISRLVLQRYYPSSSSSEYTYTWSVDTWYALELKFIRHVTSGEYRAYLNGTEVIADTGLDTTGVTGINTVQVGQIASTYTVTNYVDDVTVNNSDYIGPDDPIFQDDFESGGFGNWTGTSSGNGGISPEVIQVDPRAGTNHMRVYIDGSASGGASYVYKSLNDLRSIYVSGYFKFKVGLPHDGNPTLRIIQIRDTDSIGRVNIKYSGSPKWEIEQYGGSVSTAADGPSLNTWYFVQVWLQLDSVNGAMKLYVDGVEKISETGVANDGRGNIAQFDVGIRWAHAFESEVLIDSVVVQEFGPIGQDNQLFVDGFESGDFGQWTATNGTPEITSDNAFLGSYSSKHNAIEEYTRKDFTEQTTVFVRIYWLYNGSITLDWADWNSFLGLYKGTTLIARLHMRSQTLPNHVLKLQSEFPSSATNEYSWLPTSDTWYSIELKFVRHATNGEYRVYLDGTEVLSRTGVDTTGVTGADRIQVGVDYWFRGGPNYVLVDYVTVATAYVGVEYLFADGFESGDFSAWTGTIASAGETVDVISTESHDGDYTARFKSDASATYEYAYIYKNFASSQSVIYSRMYWMLKTSIASDKYIYIMAHQYGTSASQGLDTWQTILEVINDAGTMKWVVAYNYDATWTTMETTTPAINTDQWYSLELYSKIHASSGEYKLYINGVEELSVTGLDSSQNGDLDQFRYGLTSTSGPISPEVYVDDVIVSTNYIGMEHLFEDGFESNDFSAWTGTAGTPAIVSGGHHGDYEAKFDVSGEYASKTFSPQNHLHLRLYFRVGNLDGTYDIVNLMSDSDKVVWIQLLSDGNIRMIVKDVTSNVYIPDYAAYAAGVTTDRWYFVELEWLYASSTGGGEFWVDGTSGGSDYTSDTTNYGEVNGIQIGTTWTNDTAPELYIDDVVISRSYIGSEVNSSPNNPSSLGPINYVNGSSGTDNTPTLQFTQSDLDSSDTLRYRIQIDNSSDFASPVVDYTSAFLTQGAVSFTVGQAAGSGTYTVGSEGQTLLESAYYWRVMSEDQSNSTSSWATANSGNTAFIYLIPIGSFTPSLVSTTGSGNIYPNLGGKVSKTFESGQTITIIFPPFGVKERTTINIEPQDKEEIIKTNPLPENTQIAGDLLAELEAISQGKELEQFEKEASLLFTYSDNQIKEGEIEENTLRIYWWDKEAKSWQPFTSQINSSINNVTASTLHFSFFGLMGETEEKIEEPSGEPISEMEKLLIEMIKILTELIQLYTQLIQILGG